VSRLRSENPFDSQETTVARPTLRTHVRLDTIHAIQEGDGIGDAEPYLWTAMFKIDGETVVLDPTLHLAGTCTFVPTPGSHGNLGDSDVGDGDTVPIPAAVGQFATTMVPIPFPGTPIDVAGVLGVVTILMEENQVSDSAAEAGHAALNQFLEKTINDLIPTLGMEKQEVTPAELEALTAKAEAAITDAIVGDQGIFRNILSFIDGDHKIGAKVNLFNHDVLTNQHSPIYERMQFIVKTVNQQGQPVEVLAQDFELRGEVLGVDPSGHGVETFSRSREYGSPVAAGSPTGIVVPGLGVHDLVYRDPAGHLHELWRDSAGTTGTTDLTANAQARAAAADPMAYVETSTGMLIVLYRGDDNRVRSLYWTTGAVGTDDLSGSGGAPGAAGRPFGYFVAATNTNHVIYRTTEGRLHELWWTPVDAVGHGDLTGLSDAPRPAGDPVAYVDTLRLDNIVVFRGTDQHIHSIYWSTGAVGHDNLSGFTGAPRAAGEPDAYYRANDDSHQIVYRSADGGLHEIWWAQGGNANWWDISSPAGAPPAASDPSTYYSAGTNTKHVIYRSADNHLHEIWWTPGGGTPTHVDLTLYALADLATVKPSAFVVDGPNTHHVAYRGTDGHVHEIRRTGAPLVLPQAVPPATPVPRAPEPPVVVAPEPPVVHIPRRPDPDEPPPRRPRLPDQRPRLPL
jgi:hypothetical protein